MLVIRDAQMAALGRALDETLVRRIVDHLAGAAPTLVAALTRTEQCARVRLAIEEARRHGLTTDRSLTDFARRSLEAPGFFAAPASVAALARVAAHPSPDARYTLFDLDVHAFALENRADAPEL
jgi:hypothetical protein